MTAHKGRFLETEAGERVERAAHELAAEAPAPKLGEQVNGVDLAGAVGVVIPARSDAGETSDLAVEVCDEVGLAVRVPDPPR